MSKITPSYKSQNLPSRKEKEVLNPKSIRVAPSGNALGRKTDKGERENEARSR
jgi:hypothetical protein